MLWPVLFHFEDVCPVCDDATMNSMCRHEPPTCGACECAPKECGHRVWCTLGCTCDNSTPPWRSSRADNVAVGCGPVSRLPPCLYAMGELKEECTQELRATVPCTSAHSSHLSVHRSPLAPVRRTSPSRQALGQCAMMIESVAQPRQRLRR